MDWGFGDALRPEHTYGAVPFGIFSFSCCFGLTFETEARRARRVKGRPSLVGIIDHRPLRRKSGTRGNLDDEITRKSYRAGTDTSPFLLGKEGPYVHNDIHLAVASVCRTVFTNTTFSPHGTIMVRRRFAFCLFRPRLFERPCSFYLGPGTFYDVR
ncbi:hypothetical protein VTN02DRAFT_4606 [Thermoascus thermophilus]